MGGEAPTTPQGHQTSMDRKLARKNLRAAYIAGAICFFMFGISFVAAAIYLSA